MEHCFGVILLEHLSSVTQKDVMKINSVIVSGWSAIPPSQRTMLSQKRPFCSWFCSQFSEGLFAWKGAKGIPTKGIGKKILKVTNFRVFSGCFQGIFREFLGTFRVFSGCFQGVFPYVLSGYAIWTLPIRSSQFCLGPFADWNLSSTELESGNILGAFLQTSAPVLDKISGLILWKDPFPKAPFFRTRTINLEPL